MNPIPDPKLGVAIALDVLRGAGGNATPFNEYGSQNRMLPDLEGIILAYANRADLPSQPGPLYNQLARSIREQSERIAPLIGALPPFAATKAYVDDVVERITTAAKEARIAPEKIQIADLDQLIDDTQQAIKDRDLCVVFEKAMRDNPGILVGRDLLALPIGREKARAIDTLLVANPALFDGVRNLDLAGLRLKTIPTQIQYFTNLRLLFLNDNQIQTLVGVNLPVNVRWLGLNNNQIQTLVGVNLPANLKWLFLRDNQIQTLVGVNLPANLRTLFLDNNQIQTLVGVNLPANLEWLCLTDNQIQTLVGVNLPVNLRMLGLQDNQIRTMVGVILPAGLVPKLEGNPIEG